MIDPLYITNAAVLVSGVALVLCSRYLLERARRCELSTRAGVAALLGLEGAISIAMSVTAEPIWWGVAVCTSLTAATAWLIIGTRYGRRCAQIDTWGITEPDDLADAPSAGRGVPVDIDVGARQ